MAVVVDLQPVLFPRAGFSDHVQQNEMTAGPIGECDLVHGLSFSRIFVMLRPARILHRRQCRSTIITLLSMTGEPRECARCSLFSTCCCSLVLTLRRNRCRSRARPYPWSSAIRRVGAPISPAG